MTQLEEDAAASDLYFRDEIRKLLPPDEAMQGRAKTAFKDQKPDNEAAIKALVDFAGKEGYAFTVKEAKEFSTTIAASGELDDADLKKVSGGFSTELEERREKELKKVLPYPTRIELELPRRS